MLRYFPGQHRLLLALLPGQKEPANRDSGPGPDARLCVRSDVVHRERGMDAGQHHDQRSHQLSDHNYRAVTDIDQLGHFLLQGDQGF